MTHNKYAQSLFSLLSLSMGNNYINGFPVQLGASKSLEMMKDDLLSLSPDQAIALSEILLSDDNVVTICGKAGSGKTYFIKTLKEVLKHLFKNNLLVVASTGIASQNCEGSGTLNSVFRVGLGNKLPWDWVDEDIDAKFQRRNAQSVADTPFLNFNVVYPTVVIIDEISMVSSELLNVVYQIALYKYGAPTYLSKAAHSIKFVCFGDTLQLLPIQPKSKKTRQISNFPWHKAQYQTSSNETHEVPSLLTEGYPEIDSFKCKRLGLITNHRQKDEAEFIEALNYIRLGGNINEGPARALLPCIVKSDKEIPDTSDTIHLYFTNAEVFERNKKVVEQQPESDRKKYYAQVKYGNLNGNVTEEVTEQYKDFKPKKKMKIWDERQKSHKTLDKYWIPEWALPIQELAINLPFMIRQNMPDRDLYNGTVGIIKELHEGYIIIELDNGEYHKVEPTSCQGVSTDTAAEFIALPGHLACALTINKSQGLTINRPLVVNIRRKHAKYIPPHSIYVAFSRVTKRDLLYINSDISTINESIKIEESALEFTKEAENNMRNITGKLLSDTVSPSQVRNSEPILKDVKVDEECYLFYFRTYVEVDYYYDVEVHVDKETSDIRGLYDFDDGEWIGEDEWPNTEKAKVIVKEVKSEVLEAEEYEPKL